MLGAWLVSPDLGEWVSAVERRIGRREGPRLSRREGLGFLSTPPLAALERKDMILLCVWRWCRYYIEIRAWAEIYMNVQVGGVFVFFCMWGWLRFKVEVNDSS